MLEMPDGKYFRYPFATCKSTAVALSSRHLRLLSLQIFYPKRIPSWETLNFTAQGKRQVAAVWIFWSCFFFRWSWSNRGKDDRPNFWSDFDWGVDVGKITGECREWRVAIGRNIKGLNIELNLRNRLGVWYITCKVGGEIIPKKIQVSKGSLLRGHQIPLHANTWELHHLPSSKIYCYQISNFVMFFFQSADVPYVPLPFFL